MQYGSRLNVVLGFFLAMLLHAGALPGQDSDQAELPLAVLAATDATTGAAAGEQSENQLAGWSVFSGPDGPIAEVASPAMPTPMYGEDHRGLFGGFELLVARAHSTNDFAFLEGIPRPGDFSLDERGWDFDYRAAGRVWFGYHFDAVDLRMTGWRFRDDTTETAAEPFPGIAVDAFGSTVGTSILTSETWALGTFDSELAGRWTPREYMSLSAGWLVQFWAGLDADRDDVAGLVGRGQRDTMWFDAFFLRCEFGY